MRLGLLSLPLAASLLALLACAGLAGAARNLAQTDGVAGEVAGVWGARRAQLPGRGGTGLRARAGPS